MSLSWSSIDARVNGSRAGRHILFALRRIGDDISLPFKALKKGHLLLALYTIGLSLLALWGTLELSAEWYQVLLSTRQQTGLTPITVSRIWVLSTIFLWICTLPILLTAVALPLRVLWVRGTLTSPELFTQTLSSIGYSLRAIGLTLRIELYQLIPVFAMAMIYIAFVRTQQQAIVTQLYTLALIAVCISTIWKSLPVLLAPLLAIIGHFDGRDATRYAGLVFRPRELEFLLLILVLLGTMLGIYLQFHGHGAAPKHFHPAELFLYGLSGWYGLSLLSFKTMQALNAASASAPEQKQQPAQQQATAQEQQRPVINIQNLWVSQDENGNFKIKNPQQ